MKLLIEIELGNAFVLTYDDLAIIMRRLAVDFDVTRDCTIYVDDGHKVRDPNGNTVGKWRISENGSI